jgi:type IV fimbrial biogenesis protein FimT
MKHAGFTVVELLIVLALLAILANFAAPPLGELIDAQRRKATAEALASGIRSARVAAITRNRIVTIHALDADWSNGWRIVIDEDGKGPDDNDPVLIERADASRTRVVGNSKVAEHLSFDGLGGLRRAGNGTLHVCVKGEPVSHYRVIVNITGRVRLTEARRHHVPCA